MDFNLIEPHETTVQHLFALYSALEVDKEYNIIEYLKKCIEHGITVTNLDDFPKIKRRIYE